MKHILICNKVHFSQPEGSKEETSKVARFRIRRLKLRMMITWWRKAEDKDL
jgi:hypothetical protein